MSDNCRIPPSRVVWFFSLAAIGCLADLVTKQLVFASPVLYRGSEWWLIEGHIGIQKSLNEGALFGIGQGNVWLFAFFSIAAALAIPIWLFGFRAARERWLTLALGCVLGGILGNLYDRLGLHGLDWGVFDPTRAGQRVYAVRDFLLVQWDASLVWPNFNIADSLLVFGACALLVQSFFCSLNPSQSCRSTDRIDT
ncbi:MAG: signal peptidase II [Planctomycetales bacterium]|nr:signal peptidase II [Planctomycetales bacterium]